jgi:hypothetical protein
MEFPQGICLLQAEVKTGHILDLKGEWYSYEKNQPTFLFFDSIEDAKLKAKEIIISNPLIEVSIFENGNFIEIFRNMEGFNVLEREQLKKRRWWQFWKMN